jgi:hypothetical protein
MRKALLCVASLVSLLALACQTPILEMSEADQRRVERELAGQQRYVRVALYLGSLWMQTDLAYLTDRPADEIDLVDKPSGAPIRPPATHRVLPPGAQVRITRIEWPTTFNLGQRVVVSPRWHPWVYLQVPGESRPAIIVLPQEVKTYDDARVELERYLSVEDPGPALAALPQEIRGLVLAKEAGPGMSARALEMAWGFPERKKIDRPAGTEEWFWVGGNRHAYLRDDRVEKVER